jgi:hypothetical protein
MKLSEIQKKLKAPKDKTSSFGGYNYRTCGAILEAVKHIMDDGDSVILTDEIVEVAGRVYVKAIATFSSNSGETVSASAFAREPQSKKGMDEQQITGAASTYARKTALGGLFAIDDSTDDPDATNTGTTPKAAQSRSKTPKVSDETEQARQRLIKAVKAYAELHGGDYKALAEGVAKRPDYEPTAEFYNAVAMEFEMENQ